MNVNPDKIIISFSDEEDRENIYTIRHQVYATELGQYTENEQGRLTDQLDSVNCYLVAKIADNIVGFVSITPPNEVGYSIDKYFARGELPILFNEELYEIRLLTVLNSHRGSFIASLLLYGALCYVESRGGQAIVAIGRLEVLKMYLHAGMQSLGRQVRSGKVTYELIAAQTNDLRKKMSHFQKILARLDKSVDWRLTGVDFHKKDRCFHGGDFFNAIGNGFENLHEKDSVINADVLDAWFDPAPNVLAALSSHLSWALKTSPPTGSEGMRRMLALGKGVKDHNILPGSGSSDLIFLGLRHWLQPESRVLILDPMYGEYLHVLESIVGCQVDRFPLSPENNFVVDIEKLAACLKLNYDWVILVNPNSPTGQHIERQEIESLIKTAPLTTRFWIDETYIDYVNPNESLEQYAAASFNVIICKSMSKVYALSGARCAYLCGPSHLIGGLEIFSPPWAVSLPAQIAACEALRNVSYYQARWEETSQLREELSKGLRDIGWEVVPSHANFLLCRLPEDQPEASELIKSCHNYKLYLRDVSTMGKCFDTRYVRVAVKDASTNSAMIHILELVLEDLRSAKLKRKSAGPLIKTNWGVAVNDQQNR